MKTSIFCAVCSLVLSGHALAVPMGYDLFQDGFSGGGILTGTILVDDLNGNGQVTYFNTISGPQEVSSLMIEFSGNATVPAFSASLANVSGLQWDLDPVFGDGSGGPGLLKEGMKINVNIGGTFYQYLTGFSAFGAGPVKGHIERRSDGAVTQTGNFAMASPIAAVPSGGTTLGMFGLGLVVVASVFRKSRKKE